MNSPLKHNEEVFEKIKLIVFAAIEKAPFGKITLELNVHEKRITKLTVFGSKTIK